MLHVKFECFDCLDIDCLDISFLGYFCLKIKQGIFLDIESRPIVWHELGGTHTRVHLWARSRGSFMVRLLWKTPSWFWSSSHEVGTLCPSKMPIENDQAWTYFAVHSLWSAFTWRKIFANCILYLVTKLYLLADWSLCRHEAHPLKVGPVDW